MPQDEDKQFEKDVRRIAALLWPSAQIAGAIMIDGREHDGVFETEECVHLVECTTSRSKQKAVDDCKKLNTVSAKLRKQKPDKAIKTWFVTRDDPTAEQKFACHQNSVVAESFHQFQARIINALDYLMLRKKHRFGSAYDPRTDSYTENFEYVEIDLRESGPSVDWRVKDLARSAQEGNRFVLLGDYGVGKSMTLREVFFRLADGYSRVKSPMFPVYLNLREHHGQKDPSEILERHARSIGYGFPSHLVRAWKAGYVILILDGFDEFSSLGLQGEWKRLRQAKRSSMEGVRRIVRDSPKGSGIILAGRDTFFDLDSERREALEAHDFHEIKLGEFTERQIERFLLQLGYAGQVPSWMPSRPLLLSTLFSKGIRRDAGEGMAALLDAPDASGGWDLLLNELCEREAKIESGLSGKTIRELLENLATRARAKANGLGPIGAREMTDAFIDVCQYEPADQSLIVLQRLPGMGRDAAADSDARTFIDSDLADACRAGDLIRFVINPYGYEKVSQLCAAAQRLGEIGLGIVTRHIHEHAGDRIGVVIRGALKMLEKQQNSGGLMADLVLLCWRAGVECSAPLTITNANFDYVRFTDATPDTSGVSFDACYFAHVGIDSEVDDAKLPHFNSCMIVEVDGRVSQNDLPAGKFTDCDIDGFLEGTLTNESIQELPVSTGVKVLLTLLKKLFVQSLGGRKEGALFRGMDGNLKPVVLEVLAILSQNNIITKSGRAGEPIWIPVRRQRRRVMQMLNAPSTSNDEVLALAKNLV